MDVDAIHPHLPYRDLRVEIATPRSPKKNMVYVVQPKADFAASQAD